MIRRLLRGKFYARMLVKDIIQSSFVNNNGLYKYFLNKRIEKRFKVYKKRARSLIIECTNNCNADCQSCRREDLIRMQGVMDMPLFKKIIDDAVESGYRYISLTGFGESFLDKKLAEKISYIKSFPNMHVSLFTNGQLVTSKAQDEVIEAGLDEIIFSVDSVDAEEFNKTRKNLDFNRVVKNIEELSDLKKKLGRTHPNVVISSVASSRRDLPRIKKIYNFFSKMVDLVYFAYEHNWADLNAGKIKQRIPCYFPWDHQMIGWDGRVALCCIDYNCNHLMGDLKTQSLSEIWNSSEKIRTLHLEGKMNDIELCKHCTFFPNWWTNDPA